MSALTHCPHCGGSLTPAQEPLTKRQAEVLAYVRETIAIKGYAPTFSEIAEHCGYRSLGTVHEHLENLERKGYVVRGFNTERAITLVEAPVHA